MVKRNFRESDACVSKNWHHRASLLYCTVTVAFLMFDDDDDDDDVDCTNYTVLDGGLGIKSHDRRQSLPVEKVT